MTEPHWVRITKFGDTFEVEVDIRLSPPRYRHRPLHIDAETGLPFGEGPWKPGKPDQPITQFQIDRVKVDRCPRCNGELDTGWECTVCGYDAMWIAQWIADDDICGNV